MPEKTAKKGVRGRKEGLKKSTKSTSTTSLLAARTKEELASERSELVLWKRPFKTFAYFLFEIPPSLRDAGNSFIESLYDSKSNKKPRVISETKKMIILLTFAAFLYGLYFFFFQNDPSSTRVKEDISWFSYWVFLGILSSVGLGTGLHTFLLYLGPFIAKVTVAAQECHSVQFPRPPYPDQVICPDFVENNGSITIFEIMKKIRWESLMWGFGTALGELPPYFMARAARLSGMVTEDEELEEFNELLQLKKERDPSRLNLVEKGKLYIEDIVEKVGFWGILACASIPNPLFDLAGITCGHFLVPFTTFFGATVIGKALVKTHLQMTFVILAFNEELLQSAVILIGKIPHVGPMISEPFVKLMTNQKQNLHHGNSQNSEGGLLGFILEKVVLVMVVYFVVSIVNSMAQSHHKRISREKKQAQS